jgi:hypothetical protein
MSWVSQRIGYEENRGVSPDTGIRRREPLTAYSFVGNNPILVIHGIVL